MKRLALLLSLLVSLPAFGQWPAWTNQPGLPIISPDYGGTGVANAAASTITLGGPLITSGAFTTTITSSATTNSTLPAGSHSIAPLDSPSFTTPTLGVASATSINFGVTALSTYTQSSFTGTFTGCSSNPTPTINYTVVGNVVTLDVPLATCTSNATSKTITGMPAGIRPATAKRSMTWNSDNAGANTASIVDLATSGVLSLFVGGGNNWTASGTASTSAFVLHYTLN